MDIPFSPSDKNKSLASTNVSSVGQYNVSDQCSLTLPEEQTNTGNMDSIDHTSSSSILSGQYQDVDLQPTFTAEMNEMDFDEILRDIRMDGEFESMFRGIGVSERYPPIQVDIADSHWIGQWNRFCQLSSTTTNSAVRSQMERYSREFTAILEFRAQFSDAIERKCWDSIDPINYQVGDDNMQRAKAIVLNLQEEINAFLSDANNNLTFELGSRLQQWQRELQERYSDQPMELVQLVMKMLKKERSILEFDANLATSTISQGGFLSDGRVSVQGSARESQLERIQLIMNQISELEMHSREVTLRLDKMTSEYQQLQLCTQGNVRALANPQNFADRKDQNSWRPLLKLHESLIRNKQCLIAQYHQERFSGQLPALVMNMKQEIAVWQRAQACFNNGKNVTDYCDIDQLEDCCKPIAQLLNTSLEQIVKLRYIDVDSPAEQQNLNGLQQHYEATMKDLVKNTLVVEKQPPQVLMKDKKFVCQLRHLLGNRLSSHQFRFDTKVWLINTESASAILEGGHKVEIQPSGEILNNSAKADFIDQTKQLLVHMRNMSLRMRQRGDRGRADCVAEEKFCMIFRSNLSLRFPSNAECNVVAQTMSLPVVVISHGKQEPDAQATIFWDNAFAENLRRRPFEVPDSVLWSVMLDELDCFWKKTCQGNGGGGMQEEGRGLDEDAKRYLTMKLWGRDERNITVNWRQFNRDSLPGQNFTFWTWLFKLMELVSSPYVKKHWNAGRIKGFISKGDCQRLLMQRPLGTFLFRFSDSTLGAVSISCYTLSKYSGLNEVGHLEPDTIAKFKARSLPDIVKDINILVYLYPDLPKDTAFGQYYTKAKVPDPRSDYWPKELHDHVVSNNDRQETNLIDRSPGTPLSPGSFVPPQVQMTALSSRGGRFSPTSSSRFSPAPSHVAFSPKSEVDNMD